MFVVTFLMKKLGGKELRDLDEEIQKEMKKAREGDQKALKKMNKLNMQKMKKTFKTQLYLFPIIIGVIMFVKWKFGETVFTIPLVNWQFGWFGTFLLLGIPASIVAETLTKKILYK
ncbi:MAG: hypothetical protein GOV00_01050 [Candidatus Altiarchaeota archaeon]|nr:hypothetical protein [Candidatus Altiarchaeota archaeon]